MLVLLIPGPVQLLPSLHSLSWRWERRTERRCRSHRSASYACGPPLHLHFDGRGNPRKHHAPLQLHCLPGHVIEQPAAYPNRHSASPPVQEQFEPPRGGSLDWPFCASSEVAPSARVRRIQRLPNAYLLIRPLPSSARQRTRWRRSSRTSSSWIVSARCRNHSCVEPAHTKRAIRRLVPPSWDSKPSWRSSQ